MSGSYWYLKGCDLFQQLEDHSLRGLENRCRARTFPKKTPIYLPVDAANSVYLLVDGRAKICNLTADGKQSILTFIDPGELFGELAIFDSGEMREEYAEAVEKSTVVLIPGTEIERLMNEVPSLSMGISKLIGLRRKRIERRLRNLLFLSNRERLTHLLLELAEQYGVKSPAGIELSIKLSHQELANIIGSTRETVTVVLGELQAEKLITIGRRRINFLDLKRLAMSVQREEIKLAKQPSSPEKIGH